MLFARNTQNGHLQHNILFQAEHISGCHNRLADAVSRTQVERFRRLYTTADTPTSPMYTCMYVHIRVCMYVYMCVYVYCLHDGVDYIYT